MSHEEQVLLQSLLSNKRCSNNFCVLLHDLPRLVELKVVQSQLQVSLLVLPLLVHLLLGQPDQIQIGLPREVVILLHKTVVVVRRIKVSDHLESALLEILLLKLHNHNFSLLKLPKPFQEHFQVLSHLLDTLALYVLHHALNIAQLSLLKRFNESLVLGLSPLSEASRVQRVHLLLQLLGNHFESIDQPCDLVANVLESLEVAEELKLKYLRHFYRLVTSFNLHKRRLIAITTLRTETLMIYRRVNAKIMGLCRSSRFSLVSMPNFCSLFHFLLLDHLLYFFANFFVIFALKRIRHYLLHAQIQSNLVVLFSLLCKLFLSPRKLLLQLLVVLNTI